MILLIIFTLLLVWLFGRQFQKASRLPPGPFALPLIGNVPQILYYAWKTGGIVPMLSQFRKKYGNVFTVWLGPLPTVSIADFDVAHEVMVKNGGKYVDKLLPPIAKDINKGDGIAFTNGEAWSEQRRFALQVFRNLGMGKNEFESWVLDELDFRFSALEEKSENRVLVMNNSELFDVTVGSIINRMLFSWRFAKDPHDFYELKEKLDHFLNTSSPLDMIIPTWLLKVLFKKHYEFSIQVTEDVTEFVAKEAIERLRNARSGILELTKNNAKDFTDNYILEILENEKNGGKGTFTEENLKQMLLDLWQTGQETTTLTLNSGFVNLMKHPEVVDRLRKELMEVTDQGSRPLSLKDRLKTPYYNAVLNEIQRHASILNASFWKMNHEYTNVGGYPLDAGTVITVQLSALHTNDELFKDHEKFNPDRFLEDATLGNKVIPFGIGKRSCLGEGMAKAELYLIIGNIFLRYDVQPHGEFPTSIDMAPYSFAKISPKISLEFRKLCAH
ncbi:unnamed protein product [Caenorhabditis bovis]|uniref:CYtochrome P450 family n=1 Tax=Caenorhabditis bovis TaxID=2654633 RepID=A0A8S1ELG6_9PELO|nr:unnamed protein product [Caenorhabditis bovis]